MLLRDRRAIASHGPRTLQPNPHHPHNSPVRASEGGGGGEVQAQAM
jgi:hypothetical protein